MLRQFANHFHDMAFAIVIWMCTLPLVGMLILPLLGLKISLLVAAGLLIVISLFAGVFVLGKYSNREV